MQRFLLAILVLLSACTTETIYMRNAATGETATCGGHPLAFPIYAIIAAGHMIRIAFEITRNRDTRGSPRRNEDGISMPTGTVKFFNMNKGYGFITDDAGGPDTFVHISAVLQSRVGSLREGQRVSFEIVADAQRGKSSAQNLVAL